MPCSGSCASTGRRAISSASTTRTFRGRIRLRRAWYSATGSPARKGVPALQHQDGRRAGRLRLDARGGLPPLQPSAGRGCRAARSGDRRRRQGTDGRDPRGAGGFGARHSRSPDWPRTTVTVRRNFIAVIRRCWWGASDLPVVPLPDEHQDEVHRFAISFHRQKRSKAFIHSELQQIEGVGAKTIETLLQHFRTVEKVRAANWEELSALIGPAKARARCGPISRERSDSAGVPEMSGRCF